MTVRRPITTLTCLLALGACGGDPTGPDEEREILTAPSFALDVQEILDRRGCTAAGCHGDGSGGLDLVASNPAANYTTLVGMQAIGEAIDYVIPADADASYLVIKLEGRQSVGQRMPRGAAPLDAIDLTNIRNWINNGAPNN